MKHRRAHRHPAGHTVLQAALCAALGLSSIAGAAAPKDDGSVYIVRFAEPALASFRGAEAARDPSLAALKATSPAVTGALRLDVDTPESRAYRKTLAERRDDRLAAMARRVGRPVEPLFTYDVVFNGVALSLSEAEAGALAKVPGVVSVERESVQWPLTDAGPEWINATSVWYGRNGIPGTTGQGVVVGIIDTGIRGTHNAFRANATTNPRGRYYGLCASTPARCNNKLIGIWDFSTGSGSKEADDGSDVDGHGTHVAATVAGNELSITLGTANGPSYRTLSGVARGANLISYKACEEDAGCPESWTMAALNQAVADGVDVVNYSIGGGARNPWQDGSALAMLSAREAGVVVVVAAGNDGPGTSTVTSPSNAPWVLSVAASTHGRATANRLMLNGPMPLPRGGQLLGLGDTTGTGPMYLDIVVPTDFPLCGDGAVAEGSEPTGASKPLAWGPTHFAGKIVVCERGFYSRVAKGNNVRLAGAAGMILINQEADGASLVSDPHKLPATHLSYADGQALKAWLANGSGHGALLSGTRIENVPALGDILASFSGRGPARAGAIDLTGVLKPNITAPGVSIYAAGAGGDGEVVGMSGTSMASPHVAGAAALLRAAQPTWRADQIISALQLGARPVVRDSDGVTTADTFAQGSGMTDVWRSRNAGLYLPLVRGAFAAANPASGGQPEQLNLASIGSSTCFESCSFTRTVADLAGGGQWTVTTEFEAPGEVRVSPAAFSLTAGASQTLDITVDVDAPSLAGRWVQGAVVLRPAAAGRPELRLPVAVYASPGPLPSVVTINTPSERGRHALSLDGLVALPSLEVRGGALVPVREIAPTLVQDPTRDDAYDDIEAGVATIWLEVPPVKTCGVGERWWLSFETASSTAPDVDLYVGEDFNGNGRPEESEQLCASGGTSSTERCAQEIVNTACSGTRRFWGLAQNWRGSAQGDVVRLSAVAVPVDSDHLPAGAGRLTVTGPGGVERLQRFGLELAYDVPGLLPFGRAVGFIDLRAEAGSDAPTARIRIEARRTGSLSGPKLMVAGKPEAVVLAPGELQDRLYVDVPPNAGRMVVRSSGSGDIALYAARAEAAPAAQTRIAAAPPRASAQAASTGPGAIHRLVVEGAALTPGRWYITPVNTGSTVANVALDVAFEQLAARPQLAMGAYFNPARSGSGLQVYSLDGAGLWGFTWYAFDASGAPIWYLGVAPRPGGTQGQWTVPLQQYRWTGGEAVPTVVGDATLTLQAADRFQFSWNLQGSSGSETMQLIGQLDCPVQSGQTIRASGHWYSPQKPGFGYSLFVTEPVETLVAYVYDGLGMPRWVYADAVPFGGSGALPTRIFDGPCPLCDYRVPTEQAAGTLRRTYSGDGVQSIGLDVAFPAPLTGVWSESLPTQPVSDRIACP